MLKRAVEHEIEEYLAGDARYILFIWGPRRSGKTTVMQKFSQRLGVKLFDFDLLSERERFVPDERTLAALVHDHPVLLIDEVQAWPEATVALKILVDQFKVKIVATGSSELRQKSAKQFDSLAGRFRERWCLPLSIPEVRENEQPKAYDFPRWGKHVAETMQIFGSYPEIYDSGMSDAEKIEALEHLVETYTIKDVVTIYELKNAKLAKDLLTKIALQLGSEVSLRELADSLQANVTTVSNYVEIFIKNYVLIPLPAFKTNLRRAVSEHRKLFFLDLGIRNALVRDFRPLELRPDRGGLWENFVVSQLIKKRKNEGWKVNLYFYREYGGKEVDVVVEDYQKRYLTLEAKAGTGKVQKVFPLTHEAKVMSPENYVEVLDTVSPHSVLVGG